MMFSERKAAAEAANKSSNFAEAQKICQDILQQQLLPIEKAEIQLILVESLWKRGYSKQAKQLIDEMLEIVNKLDDKKMMAKGLSFKAIVLLYTSEYMEAVQLLNTAIILNKELRDKVELSKNYGNLGTIYLLLGDYQNALQHFMQCLQLNEETNNQSGLAATVGNLGVIYSHLKEHSKALEYFNRAISLYEEIGDRYSVANNLGNIGGVFMALLEYDKALESFSRALMLHEEIGNQDGIGTNLANIGNIYKNIDEFEKALEYLYRSLEIYEKMGKKSFCAVIIGNIGNIYSSPEFNGYDPEKAEEYIKRGIALLEELGTKLELSLFHKRISSFYKRQGRTDEALYHFEKYYELEKEVQSEEAKKQAEQLDYERKTAEREKQIAIERASTQARLEEQQKLIHNVLPPMIAERLLQNETFIADQYSGVSVLFMDLVNFTQLSARIPPRQLIYLLNTIFSAADKVMERFGLEKIKTIGDAYMAVAGAPIAQPDHAYRAARAALVLLEEMNILSITIPEELGSAHWAKDLSEINVRIGLHCGDAIGGVIGDKKFSFDLWGDAINTAARMESHGEPGRIHVSEKFAENLSENLTLRQAQYTAQTLSQGEGFSFPLGEGRDGVSFTFPLGEGRDGVSFTFPLGEGRDGVLIPRGEIEIKGKGRMKTYFLERQ
jgi:class 3 adenylate cyclase/Tfp pilus assembly protein PilF